MEQYCTSVIVNKDMVPRLSLRTVYRLFEGERYPCNLWGAPNKNTRKIEKRKHSVLAKAVLSCSALLWWTASDSVRAV